MVVYTEIIVRQNSIYLKAANLGKSFSELVADLTVDNYGRVKVAGSKTSFNTDIGCLPLEILETMSERLGKESNNKIIGKIEKRIRSAIDAQTVQDANAEI